MRDRHHRSVIPVSALAFPAIDPVLVWIGPVPIRWYALAYIIGLVGGWWYARRLCAAESLWAGGARPGPVELDDMLVFAALGVVLGGRFGHVVFYAPGQYAADPLAVFRVWEGGMAFHGGLIGAALALALFARWRRLPVLAVFDVASAVVPIGIFLGRLANFVNGELWGRAAPADLPWAMVFPRGGPVPRHPSQLYEAAAEGLLLFGLLALVIRTFGFRRPGLVAGVFGIGYAVARTACEFFREPDAPLVAGGWVTMGMALSLPMAVVGLALVARAFARPPAGAPA